VEILLDPVAYAESAAVAFFVQAGARDESTEVAGISHFIEHLAFKGSACMDGQSHALALGDLAADINAYTSEETTVYHAAVLPEYLEPLIALMGELLRPAFPAGELELERQVILEEIAQHYDDPEQYFLEQACRDYYGEHPLGNSILGTVETVGGITRAQIYSYWKQLYHAGNITMVVSGKFDRAKVLAVAEKVISFLPAGERTRVAQSFQWLPREAGYMRQDLHQEHYMYCRECTVQSDADRSAWQVLAALIGDSAGSRFYYELVETGLAETAVAEFEEYSDVDNFYVYLSYEPNRAAQVHDRVTRVLTSVLEFSNDELEGVKRRLMTRLVLEFELPMDRALAIGSEWSLRRRYSAVFEEQARIEKVTRADIQSIVRRFPLNKMSRFRYQNCSEK
jgi:predicted Zn-dependent peptidase